MTTSAPHQAGLDVLGLGNAIVDVLYEADERTLERLDLAKGTMTLVDQARMAELYAGIGPAVEMSGGSCANTMAALASLGGATTSTMLLSRTTRY
jgi:sugar/nucleoside kinase (ribokinase family)